MTEYKHIKGNLYLLIWDRADGEVKRMYHGSRNGLFTEDISHAKVYRAINHMKAALKCMERYNHPGECYVTGKYYPMSQFKAIKIAQIIEQRGEVIDLY